MEDQLGKVHQATRAALSQMERTSGVGREIAVEFKPTVLTTDSAIASGLTTAAQMQRRLQQSQAAGEIAGAATETETYEATLAIDGAVSPGHTASLQILGSSSNQFKNDILRTTIKLYQGHHVLTLVEEKLEGDAKAILATPQGRAWMTERLRAYEAASGDRLLRVRDNSELETDDLVEAWSSLGQSYLVGRSKKGSAIGQGGSRKIFADVLSAGLGGALNAETQFFHSVWRRAAQLTKLKREGKLGPDLEAELSKQLGLEPAQSSEGWLAEQEGGHQRDAAASFSLSAQPTLIQPLAPNGKSDTLSSNELREPNPSQDPDRVRDPAAIHSLLTGQGGGQDFQRPNDRGRSLRSSGQERRKHGRGLASYARVMAWAEAVERILDPTAFDAVNEDTPGGGEHKVIFDEATNRYVKITKPGFAGAQGEDAGAYIQRLALANWVFGDDIAFEGVVTLPGEHAPRLVTSQPAIKGRDATETELSGYLGDKGFHYHEGRWIHPIREVAVWDTITPGNAITRSDGSVMPIDLQVEPARADELDAVRQSSGIGRATSFSISQAASVNHSSYTAEEWASYSLQPFVPPKFIAKAFAARLADWQQTGDVGRDYIHLGRTPPVLQVAGAGDNALLVPPTLLNKVTRDAHSVPLEVLSHLPESLTDPVAIFQSRTHADSLLVLTEFDEPGSGPILVAVTLDKVAGRDWTVNQVASMYGKPASVIRQMFGEQVLYENKQKSLAWARRVGQLLPKRGTPTQDRNIIPGPEDVVKWVEERAKRNQPPPRAGE